MKYGVITYARNEFVNIGDNLMSLAIRKIYKKMGIDDKEIVDIYVSRETCSYVVNDKFLNQGNTNVNEYNLNTYSGDDYILLPMAAHLEYDFIREGWIPLPPKIIPVFIGIHCVAPDYIAEYIANYKHLGPIGCRDVATTENFRRAGYDAYTLGCLSIQAVERRKETNEQNKVFLVNVPKKIKDYIPEYLKSDVIETSQEYKLDEFYTAEERVAIENKRLEKQLELYKNKAKLVVTSKLHCALPCISMGIPTIVVRYNQIDKYKDVTVFDSRYNGLDKFMNIYEYDEFDQIDWNPSKPDIEEFKEKQLRVVIKMIENIYERYNEMTEISAFLEKDTKSVYFSPSITGYLSKKQKNDFYCGKTKYKNLLELILNRYLYETHLIIYGAGDKGKWMYGKFKNEINMAKSCIYVDGSSEKQGKKIWGINILSPDVIAKYPKGSFAVIIATNHSYDKAAQNIAKFLNENYSLCESKDYFMLDRLIKSDSMPLSMISSSVGYNWDKIWD